MSDLSNKFLTKWPGLPVVSTGQAAKEEGARGSDEQQLDVFGLGWIQHKADCTERHAV
jgi:hypothetical protein